MRPIVIKWKYWIKDFWGFTLFFFIFLKDPNNEEHFNHEYCHFLQWKKEPFMFYPKYIYYCLKYSYWDNPYEIEAREYAKRTTPTKVT